MTKSDKLYSSSRVLFSVLFGMCSLFIVNCDNHMVRYLLPTLPEPPDFIVTFVSNGGGTIPTQSVIRGGRVSKPNDPIMDGFTFAGWYTDNGTFNNEWRFSYAVMEDTTLYGKWTKDEDIVIPGSFTVSFASNGGGMISTQTVTEGGKADAPPPPIKDGYTGYAFEGWYSNPDLTLTSKWDFARDTVNGHTTLYAKWTIEMVGVDGGSFQMGSASGGNNSERPVHTVTLTGFSMSKYEVTQAQWEEVMGKTIDDQYAVANPTPIITGRGKNHPIYFVSWYDALVFCNKLSIAEGLTPAYRINGFTIPAAWGPIPTGNSPTWNAVEIVSGSTGYRLPTEAQWEYAAKGGNGSPENFTTYAGSNDPEEVAWHRDNSGGTTHEVGTKSPNGLGIYNMSGNVWEWCWDWFDENYYTNSPQTDPEGASSSSQSHRVDRGGGWSNPLDGAIRSAARSHDFPYSRDGYDGLRVVRP